MNIERIKVYVEQLDSDCLIANNISLAKNVLDYLKAFCETDKPYLEFSIEYLKSHGIPYDEDRLSQLFNKKDISDFIDQVVAEFISDTDEDDPDSLPVLLPESIEIALYHNLYPELEDKLIEIYEDLE